MVSYHRNCFIQEVWFDLTKKKFKNWVRFFFRILVTVAVGSKLGC